MKQLFLVVCMSLLCHASFSQYTISTVAGNGTAGFSGDNGNGTTAQINWPLGVCTDAAGNIYFTDNFNGRVRRVDAATGIITTIAGKGTWPDSGDGGLATMAAVRSPKGVCVDDSGNIYISCYWSVRKVYRSTGIITTVAGSDTGGYAGDGGIATSAKLSFPVGVAVDHSGNLYIADQHNNVIRKVTKSTGIISTIAGTGVSGYSGDGGPAVAAQLDFVAAVAVDRAGNVYIGDNKGIRKIDNTGTINTIAGNGMGGYSGDGGPAINAGMNTPSGLAIDSLGNLYITDQVYSVVRKIDAVTGVIKTIAGTGAPGYFGDGGPASWAELNLCISVCVNASGGTVYVADKANSRVRKLYSPTISAVAQPSTVNVAIHPNPSQGLFFVKASDFLEKVTIMNAIGEVICETNITNSGELNLTQLPTGIYLARFTLSAGSVVTEQIMIEK